MSAVKQSTLNWSAFGELVGQQRKRCGLTQVEFAELIGRQQSSIPLIEKGETQPTVETCFRIARALGVPAKKLFGVLENTP